jgi:hypothetical protein
VKQKKNVANGEKVKKKHSWLNSVGPGAQAQGGVKGLQAIFCDIIIMPDWQPPWPVESYAKTSGHMEERGHCRANYYSRGLEGSKDLARKRQEEKSQGLMGHNGL